MGQTTIEFAVGIDRAVYAAGSQTRLAEALIPPVTSQAVCQWVRQGYVPPERALEIERLFGVPREDLLSPKLRELVCPARNASND
ncbi:MAG TPA: YdaS family helix-turn-helix protein [Myxococcota bacterium]|nr:YdaS family helix-turn-helix protein [Myxococcota bacterium]